MEYLVEDCVDSSYSTALPAQRKADILAGVQRRLEEALSACYSVMSEQYGRFIRGAEGERSNASAIMNAILVILLICIIALFGAPNYICALFVFVSPKGMLGPLGSLAKPGDMAEAKHNFTDVNLAYR